MPDVTRVILDLDTGTDDALALAFAVRSSQLDIVAVTTVAGNVGVADTTENTLRVLSYLGAGHVPVHRGLSRPLVRRHQDAGYFHGERGLGGLKLPPSSATAVSPSAPQLLVDRIMAAPGQITLIATGPLTNLASAIALEPGLPAALGNLVVMGGALSGGNVTPFAEYNIFVDPEAAAQVIAACRLTMVGLDVTRQTAITRPMRDLLAPLDTETARLVYGVTAEALERGVWDVFHLHDPLAVGVAIDPTLCTVRTGTVTVETASAERTGQTTFQPEAAGAHQVCVDVDAPRFLSLLAGALSLPLGR